MTTARDKHINKQLLILLGVVVGMFGFCFALVPLYNVFCQVTGLNGKPQGQAAIVEQQAIDKSRTVTIELLATLNHTLPSNHGEFHPTTRKFEIHPGESIKTTYWVKNLTTNPIVVQAIPSVTPGLAAQHIKKMECFCFQNQPLAIGEGKEMSLIFTIDPALPKDIHTITLAYTLFDVTK